MAGITLDDRDYKKLTPAGKDRVLAELEWILGSDNLRPVTPDPKDDAADTFTPPDSAQANAQRVLDWREQHGEAVEGMTAVGWTRARQLASGEPISLDIVKRIAQFNRHRQNYEKARARQKEEGGNPWDYAGIVAWLGWGGSTGVDWAIGVSAKADAWDDRADTDDILEYLVGWRADAPKGGKKKRTEKPKCTKGRSCGMSCIAMSKRCPPDKLGDAADVVAKSVASSGGAGGKGAEPKPNPQEGSTATPDYPYAKTRQYLTNLNEANALISKINRASDSSYTIGGKALSKDEVLKQLEQKRDAIQSSLLSVALKEVQSLAEQRRSDFLKGTIISKPDPKHDWIPPSQFHIDSVVSFNPVRNTIQVRALYSQAEDEDILLSPESFRALESKYKADSDYVDSTSTFGAINIQQQAKAIAARLNVSESAAERYIAAAKQFAAEDYTAMRAVDSGKRVFRTEDGRKVDLTPWRQATKDLNEFMEKAPPYSGFIYRGIDGVTSFSRKNLPKMIDALKSDAGYTESRMSSFSSDKAVAMRFAGENDAKDKGIVLEVANNSRGVSIRNLSQFDEEEEVLVPKKTRYRYVSERKETGVTIYTIEEF